MKAPRLPTEKNSKERGISQYQSSLLRSPRLSPQRLDQTIPPKKIKPPSFQGTPEARQRPQGQRQVTLREEEKIHTTLGKQVPVAAKNQIKVEHSLVVNEFRQHPKRREALDTRSVPFRSDHRALGGSIAGNCQGQVLSESPPGKRFLSPRHDREKAQASYRIRHNSDSFEATPGLPQ